MTRGGVHDRLEDAAARAEQQEALRSIEDEIGRLEVARDALVHEAMEHDEQPSGRRVDHDRSVPDRDDDLIPER